MQNWITRISVSRFWKLIAKHKIRTMKIHDLVWWAQKKKIAYDDDVLISRDLFYGYQIWLFQESKRANFHIISVKMSLAARRPSPSGDSSTLFNSCMSSSSFLWLNCLHRQNDCFLTMLCMCMLFTQADTSQVKCQNSLAFISLTSKTGPLF